MSGYLTSERLRDIEARLARDGRVVAAELARLYDTSEDTIRRDLRTLAAEGRCRRVYGGALPATPAAGPVSARVGRAPGAKAALGAALARLVEPGMTVFIDAGSTTLAAAERVQGQGVTVVTHAPVIAAALVERPGVRLVTLGGRWTRRWARPWGRACWRHWRRSGRTCCCWAPAASIRGRGSLRISPTTRR